MSNAPAPLSDDDFDLPDVDMTNPLISGADPDKGKIFDKLRVGGGTYWIQVNETSTTKHPKFGHMCRITGKVVHVVEAQEFITKSDPPMECPTLLVGQSPTRMIKENEWGHGAQEINTFMVACDVAERDITPKNVALHFSSNSPAVGKILEVCGETTMSGAGRKFERVVWRRTISTSEVLSTLDADQLALAGLGDLDETD